MPGVLFLIENVPFELDTRVQRQTRTLVEAGFSTIVICPGARGQALYERVDDVHVYRYFRPEGSGVAAHLLEYAVALSSQLALSVAAALRHGFDVIHLANPPDLLWLVALPYRLRGKTVVYDQHDLVPELFRVRFGHRFPFLQRMVNGAERMSYLIADHVLSTNESLRRLAIERGNLAEAGVTVIRNGPHLAVDFPEVEPDPKTRRLASTVVGYLGIMNDQDHVEFFLEMARIIRFDRQRSDLAFVMIGEGTAFAALQRLRERLALTSAVRMTGHLPWLAVLRTLAATDICVQPDPPTLFNEKLTMNKLMEYMAMRKPFVAFDMHETRVSGGEGGLYVAPYTPEALANGVLRLADDPELREQLGATGRRKVEEELAWEHHAPRLITVYESLTTQETHA